MVFTQYGDTMEFVREILPNARLCTVPPSVPDLDDERADAGLDAKQLDAVDAGKPFAQLQAAMIASTRRPAR